MFSKKTKADLPLPADISKSTIPSIIASDLNILGNLVSEGVVEIQGKIEGNLICAGATIRQQGCVKGDIVAESIQIDGEVRGLVKARNVRISDTGKVTGIVMYETLSIKDGAFIDGQCKNTDISLKDRENATLRLAEKLYNENGAAGEASNESEEFIDGTAVKETYAF